MSAIEQLRKRLEEFSTSYKEFQKTGIDPEILFAYVHYKTKLSKKTVQQILDAQEEFYQKLINQQLLDNLEKENE